MSENAGRKKTVRTFAAASFLNDMGSDMIYPIWPLFVTSLGANMAVLGFIDGIGDAVVSVSQAVSGYISDRIRKRKVFIWLGYAFAFLSRVGYAFSTIWQALIPFRVLDRAGKMRGAPRDAMIADLSTQTNRGESFGILRAMDNLGAVCGILLCILLFQYLGYRDLFLIAAVPSIIAVFLILFRIREEKTGETKVYKGIRLSDLDGNLQLFIFLSSLFALGSFSYSFLLITSKDYGFQLAFIPVFYLIFTAVAFLCSLPFGRLSDRMGRKLVLFLSFVLWGLVCLTFLFLKGAWAVFVAFVLYGLHRGALDTVQKAFVSELGPEAFRASVLGGFQMVTGLCALPASLLAGLLWDQIGMHAPYALSLGLTASAAVLLLFVKEKRATDA
jgi:MFS family permease